MQELPSRAGIPELVRAAQRGDPRAWDRLVAEFTPLLRRAIRSYRLSHHDTEDALQATWMRAWASIGKLQEPAAIVGWLLTTARRCALRTLESRSRELLVDDPAEEVPQLGPSLDERLIEHERSIALRGAIRRLPVRQRMMVEALMRDRDGGYQRIADELGVPIGSIGPTRARSFERLRGDAALALTVAI